MESAVEQSIALTESQFERISRWVKELCGINLHTGKKELVKARLGKLMRQKGCSGFEEYLDLVEGDASGDELTAMLDALSTNLTYFFREPAHFNHLREVTIPQIVARQGRVGRLRVWSAGCSSGEEPYSIAITLCEAIPGIELWDAKVLATDLSTRMLSRAREGVYEKRRFKDVSPAILSKYFDGVQARPQRLYRVKSSVRQMVHFARLNLMDPWPMRGPFDVIFCRNVMIYFDKETQGRLVNRYYDLLAPGGTLFIGHSESLTGVKHSFKYIRPTVYAKG